jgi:ABC-2 type transport system permease protein
VNAFRSELLKVGTIRTLVWLAVAEVGLVLIAAVSVAASSGPLESAADHRSVARIAAVSLVFALIAGIIVMAGESTHGTITQTLLVTPVRERVLAAKAALAALLGFVLALIAVLLVLAITVPGASLDLHEARLVFLGILVGAPLAGMLGVGFGAVVRSQGSGIGMSLLWLLLGENVVTLMSQTVAKLTPGRSFAALVSGERSSGALLGMGAGAGASVAWTAVLCAVGLFVFLGRDV